MRRVSAIIATDSPSRDGIRVAPRVLFDMLADRWSSGMPQLIMHDAHRLAGWVLPDKLIIRPDATRLHATLHFPENAEDREVINDAYQVRAAERNNEISKESIERLRTLVQSHLFGTEKLHGVHGTCLIGDGLARRVARDVFSMEDKDGLIGLNTLDSIAPGVFRIGDTVLFAHPGFRRSLSRWNSLNEYLLAELQRLASMGDVTVRVRLDPDMVGLRGTIIKPVEWAYWYGPQFVDALDTIPTGLAVHVADEDQKFYHSISRTEFWWQSRDRQHIFEAEELRDQPTHSAAGNRYGCRYVHSIVDETTKQIVHFDGAIREYSEEELLDRLDKKLSETGRQTDYTKVWRVDGAVPLSAWKLLLHHHFRDNDLVAEYLEPSAGHRADYRGDTLTTPPGHPVKSRECAPTVQLQLVLSAPVALNETRVLGPLRYFSRNEETFDYVELDTIELAKALMRRGESLPIPAAARYVLFNDLYTNFPLVRHRAAADVGTTVSAFRTLLGAWVAHGGDDRRVSLALAAPVAGHEVTLSAAGTPEHLLEALDTAGRLFMCENNDQILEWVDDTAERIRVFQHWVSCRGLTLTGPMFNFDRTIINPADIRLSSDGADDCVVAKDLTIVEGILTEQLTPEKAYFVIASACSHCGTEYKDCPCSTVIDTGVFQTITEAEPAFLFWTDRSAGGLVGGSPVNSEADSKPDV